MKYKIYPALHSEIRKGNVWSTFQTDSYLVKIKNLENNKSIVVAHRFIEDNFKNIYQKHINNNNKLEGNSIIVIDEYYRKKLNIFTRTDFDLEIKPVKRFSIRGNLSYLKNHPDEVVKITFWFAFLTFVFSLFSYVISYNKLIDIINLSYEFLKELFLLIFKKT